MKTLADLKRTLKAGTAIMLEEAPCNPLSRHIGKLRYVASSNTTGIYIKGSEEEKGRGSFMAWPKAKCLICRDDGFDIMEGGQVALSYKIFEN